MYMFARLAILIQGSFNPSKKALRNIVFLERNVHYQNAENLKLYWWKLSELQHSAEETSIQKTFKLVLLSVKDDKLLFLKSTWIRSIQICRYVLPTFWLWIVQSFPRFLHVHHDLRRRTSSNTSVGNSDHHHPASTSNRHGPEKPKKFPYKECLQIIVNQSNLRTTNTLGNQK